MPRSEIPRIAKGATLTQLLYAANNAGVKVVSGKGSEAEGWILRIEPRDKSKEFFVELFKVLTGDRIRAIYPSPLSLMRR